MQWGLVLAGGHATRFVCTLTPLGTSFTMKPPPGGESSPFGHLLGVPGDRLTRVRPFVIPAADLAITVHRGSHDDIDVSYGALGTYVSEHALGVAGPVHEIYLIGPRDTDERSSWRTEIGWPVFRTSAK
jgi:hypothetical protein